MWPFTSSPKQDAQPRPLTGAEKAMADSIRRRELVDAYLARCPTVLEEAWLRGFSDACVRQFLLDNGERVARFNARAGAIWHRLYPDAAMRPRHIGFYRSHRFEREALRILERLPLKPGRMLLRTQTNIERAYVLPAQTVS